MYDAGADGRSIAATSERRGRGLRPAVGIADEWTRPLWPIDVRHKLERSSKPIACGPRTKERLRPTARGQGVLKDGRHANEACLHGACERRAPDRIHREQRLRVVGSDLHACRDGISQTLSLCLAGCVERMVYRREHRHDVLVGLRLVPHTLAVPHRVHDLLARQAR